MHEIEACINSRPLTYVGETRNPLTPSHFLLGRSTPMNSVNTGEFSREVNDLILRDECQSHYVDMFWDIWRDEYLRNLPPMSLKKPNSDLKIGSVVLVRNETKSRLLWPKGIVTKLFPGKDGHVRAVELKTNKGLICRAVQKLHRLGFSDETDVAETCGLSDSPEEVGKTDRAKAFSSQEEQMISLRGRTIKPREKLDL